jgi:adenylosuccinate synthase
VGAQWGDEGKGKFVDLLSSQAGVVARYNGGDNAGHTVVNPFGTFKLRLTPNGFSTPEARCAIGPGVVVNLATLASEIEMIQSHGISLSERVWVSPRCHVVMPYHPRIEAIYEEAKGDARTGTTRRGMGPVYADKVSYNGIRLFDLFDPDNFAAKLRLQLAVKNRIFAAFGQEPLDFKAVYDETLERFDVVREMVREPFGMIREALAAGQTVLLEGAQAALLDNDWGTYPFCTASTTLAGGAAAGLGLPPRLIESVIGVAKAYTTRVGAGPFPSELLDETGEAIRTAGSEYGTVTGRARRCGWLDVAALRFTAQLSGLTALALTKLDVLDGLETIRICTGYRLNGKLIEYWEVDARGLERVEPVYLDLPGWRTSISEARSYRKLPEAAQVYVETVESLSGVPVRWVSVGPERDATIER